VNLNLNGTAGTEQATSLLKFRLTSVWPSMESPSGCVVEEQYCRSGLPGDLDCETSYRRDSWLSQYSICWQDRVLSIILIIFMTNYTEQCSFWNSQSLSWSWNFPLFMELSLLFHYCTHKSLPWIQSNPFMLPDQNLNILLISPCVLIHSSKPIPFVHSNNI